MDKVYECNASSKCRSITEYYRCNQANNQTQEYNLNFTLDNFKIVLKTSGFKQQSSMQKAV